VAGAHVTDWLPSFVEFEPRDWNAFDAYIERVYEVFVADFVRRRPPELNGKRVALRRYPEFQGKHSAFWHLVTEGKIEDARTPDLERCRRIGWPRAILERATDRQALRAWKNERANDQRVLIALPDFSYVVVLDEREDKTDRRRYFLLLTAYPIDREHRRDKLRKEYEAWVKAQATKG
jgi:hypothetical protein